MTTIQQQHYPTIEIDNSEKDIIQIWMNGKEDTNVVQVERGNLFKLIGQLQQAWFANSIKKHMIALHEEFKEIPAEKVKQAIQDLIEQQGRVAN